MHADARQQNAKTPGLAHRPGAAPFTRLPLVCIGVILCMAECGLYFAGILFSVLRIVLALREPFRAWNEAVVWYSGVPVTLGLALIGLDLALIFPEKRRLARSVVLEPIGDRRVVVALTAYNDDLSIAEAVADFQAHPLVERVIVVDTNSTDTTSERARS